MVGFEKPWRGTLDAHGNEIEGNQDKEATKPQVRAGSTEADMRKLREIVKRTKADTAKKIRRTR